MPIPRQHHHMPSGLAGKILKFYKRGDYRAVIRLGRSLAGQTVLSGSTSALIGASYEKVRAYDDAASVYAAAVAAAPEEVSNFRLLADLLRRAGRWQEAIAMCEQGLAHHPQAPDLLFLYGKLLSSGLRYEEAVNAYCRVLVVQPDHLEAVKAMGGALAIMGDVNRAVEAFCTALLLDPEDSTAIRDLGQILTQADRLDEAVSIFRLALQKSPGNAFLKMRKSYQQLHVADWSEFGDTDDLLADPSAVSDLGTPFIMLAFADDPAVQLRHSRDCASHIRRETGTVPRTRVQQRLPGEPIRIGYLSGDFYNHATVHLMAGLFREHDRTAFQIHALSVGPDREDAVRRELVSWFDTFTDLHKLDDAQAAELIRQADLDILVDLKGYTGGCRPGILARRPAPLQISYVGYPGSLGADFIDYLVADEIVIPASERAHYTENIIYLPGSYQPTNDRRPIAPKAPTRRELNLPEDAFVFCCFNMTYKITPVEFDLWMRLLVEVDGSVLWILSRSPCSQANLRAEAARRGVDPQRLVFASIAAPEEHLARLSRADLFLDTFRVNAHTTMSDALWGGLPAVTFPGRQFAARVGASLLSAIGLTELIAEDPAAYERLCLDLARDPDRLAGIRARLAEARMNCPLFDTRSYTRSYETGLRQAFERARSGLPPTDIYIR